MPAADDVGARVRALDFADDASARAQGSRVTRDPTVALVMGIPKLGKTATCIWCWPQAMFIAAPGALKAAESVCGVTIPRERIRNADTVRGAVTALDRMPTGAPAAVVDDLTLIVDNSVRDYESKGVIKWDLWRCIRNDLLDLRRKSRALGIHVAFTLHEIPPNYKDVKRADGSVERVMTDPGGPALPGQMKMGLPAICDGIWHAKRSDALVSLWPTVFRNPVLDPRYVGVGVRELPPIDPLPDNLAEILRTAGHSIAEPFKGHEEVVEKLASVFMGAPDAIRKLAEEAAPRLDKRFEAQGARAWVRRTWVLRDALARAQLRMAIKAYRDKPVFYGGDSSGVEL